MFQWHLQPFLVFIHGDFCYFLTCLNFVPAKACTVMWCFSTHPQVSCLSAVPGPSDICSTWGQHSSLQQDPEWICPGVSHNKRARAAAETEEGQPPREEQDQGKNDNRCKRSSPRARVTQTLFSISWSSSLFSLYFLNSMKQYEQSLDTGYIFNLVKAPNVAISDRHSIHW